MPEALANVPPHLSLSQRPYEGVWRSLTPHTRLLWNLTVQVTGGATNILVDYTDLAP